MNAMNRRYPIAIAAAALLILCIPPTANAQPQGERAAKANTAETTDAISSRRPSPSDELARIGDDVITRAELTSYTALIEATEGQQMETSPPIEDFVLQKAIGDVYTTVTTEEKTDDASPFSYSNISERTYLKSRLRDKLRGDVKPTEAQMQEWFKANISRYVDPEKIRAHHLFMAVSADDPSSSPQSVRKRITEVKQEADKGTSFGLLAQEHSEAASAASGGDIGTVTYRMPIGPQNKPMNIVLDEALFKLKTGQVSDILQTSHGLHLMYAKEHTTTRTPTLSDLKTSGILPMAIENDLLTSRIRELIADTVKKHDGKVTYPVATQVLSTNTQAFEIGGQKMSVHHLETLYGPRFTQAFMQRRGNPEMVRDLMRQAMEDEAFVRAAVDAGVDKSTDAKRDLQLLRERAAMKKKMQAIVAQDFPATDEEARALYEEQKEQFRQTELAGEVLVAKLDPAAAPAEAERAKEVLRKKLQDIQKKANEGGADLVQLAKEVLPDDDNVTASKIERHVPGTLPGETARYFDQAGSALEQGRVSDVAEIGNALVIAKVTEKQKTEPIAYERMAQRLKRQLQVQNERKAREQVLKLVEQNAKVKWMAAANEDRHGDEAHGRPH